MNLIPEEVSQKQNIQKKIILILNHNSPSSVQTNKVQIQLFIKKNY